MANYIICRKTSCINSWYQILENLCKIALPRDLDIKLLLSQITSNTYNNNYVKTHQLYIEYTNKYHPSHKTTKD